MLNAIKSKAVISAQRSSNLRTSLLSSSSILGTLSHVLLDSLTNPAACRSSSDRSGSRHDAPVSAASSKGKQDSLEKSSDAAGQASKSKPKAKRSKKKKSKGEELEPEKRWPHEIVGLTDKRSLRVSFDDGKDFIYSAELLRVESPCADSRQRVISGRRHINIMEIIPEGNNSIRIKFDDLHQTGIYTWPFLYTLGAEKYQRMRSYIRALRAQGLTRDPLPPRTKKAPPASAQAGKGASAGERKGARKQTPSKPVEKE